MSIQLDESLISPVQQLTPARELLLIWQNPGTRRFCRVGHLDQFIDGSYQFSYVKDVASIEGFFPLNEYPDLDGAYSSDSLSAFFTNRVMSPERESYQQYLGWLGLDEGVPDLPLEILVRTGGGRATDTFHVVDRPALIGQRYSSRFFVSGLAYADRSMTRVRNLKEGDRLQLRAEPDNPANSMAILLDIASGAPVGWVPDWLCGELLDLKRQGYLLQATVERVSLDAPAHIRVLTRIEGRFGAH